LSLLLSPQPLADRRLAIQDLAPYSRARRPSALDVPAICRPRADAQLIAKGGQVQIVIERTWSFSLMYIAHVVKCTRMSRVWER
jgi:hypothetical protein